MKIVFMGTMDFAVPILKALESEHDIVLVVTQPDRPAGRKREPKASPVKEFALSQSMKMFQPEKIKTDYLPVLDAAPDLIVVAAFGQMIPNVLLNYPKYRCINVHASLLPKYRGGAPMHRAIVAGDKVTGVTVMYMAEKMDAGPILSQAEIPIEDDDNVGTIEAKLGQLGAHLLLDTLPNVIDGTVVPIPQTESEVTFARNLKHEEEFLDFSKTMKQIFDHVRGFYPWPVASARVDGIILKIHEVAMRPDHGLFAERANGEVVSVTKRDVCVKVADGLIVLKTIQPEGKKPMDIQSYMNGAGKALLSVGKILK